MNYEFKGTPYPWTRKGFQIWSVPKIETQLGNNTITGEWRIVDAETGYINMPHEQKFHNACLIAAAPCMLEALKETLNCSLPEDVELQVKQAIHKALNIQP